MILTTKEEPVKETSELPDLAYDYGALDAVWQVLNWPDVAERLAAARRLHA